MLELKLIDVNKRGLATCPIERLDSFEIDLFMNVFA